MLIRNLRRKLDEFYREKRSQNFRHVANGHLHDLGLHDPYGHFTVFRAGNKANVAGEKFSSDTYIHNELMRYLGDELKKDPV